MASSETYKHLFLLRHSSGVRPEPELDAFTSVRWPSTEQLEGRYALANFAGEEEMRFSDHMKEYMQAAMGMELRSRFGDYLGRGVLQVSSQQEMTRSELEAYVKSLPDSELEEFIKESKVL